MFLLFLKRRERWETLWEGKVATRDSGASGKCKLAVGSGERGAGGHSLSRKTPGPREKVEIFWEYL